jgi:LysR family nitrogen assimilation transcriptional regulator
MYLSCNILHCRKREAIGTFVSFAITKMVCVSPLEVPVNISYDLLKMIIKIAEKKSVTAAAVDMNISQPALSRKLNGAEKLLGVALFERNGRGVELTGLGQVFCEHAINIIEQFDSIQNSIGKISGQLSGSLRVVFPDGVGKVLFIPLIRRMAEKHPLVKLSFQAALPDMIPYHLNSNKADIGITANTSPSLVGRRTPIFSEALHLIGPSKSFLQSRTTVALDDVSKLPLLLPMIEGTRKLYNEAFDSIGVSPNVVFEIDSPSAMLDLVKRKEGYAILSFAMVHQLVSESEVTSAVIVDPTIERTLYLATPTNKPQTFLCRAVEREIIDLVSEFSNKAQWRFIPSKSF